MSDYSTQPSAADAYWRKTARMTMWLLAIWFVVTFSAIYFARSLANYTLFGWPVSFFMAAQGSTLIYVGIIAFYTLRMRDLDRQHGQRGKTDAGKQHAE